MKKRAQDRLGDANRWEELMKPLPYEPRWHIRGNRLDGRLPGV